MSLEKINVQDIVAIAQDASQAILQVYASNSYQIRKKSDNSPVTEADEIAHTIIEQGLRQLTVDLPFLSEESAAIPFEERASWKQFWLVDPLDGTREFIRKTGEFTVNIALIEDHQPVLGVVVVPVLKQAYWAVRGGGAYFQEEGASPRVIKVHSTVESPVKVALSHNHLVDEHKMHSLFKSVGPVEIVYCGSALKICLVARGVVDVYPRFGSTGAWDTAAGQCILEAAGGQLIDQQGQALKYNLEQTLINPGFFAIGCVDLLPYLVDKSA